MADPVELLEVLAASVAGSAALAVAFALLCGWPRKTPRPRWTSAGLTVGMLAGLALGCWWLGLVPHWPPREDQDRWLLVLLPAVLLVEIAAPFLRLGPVVWSLRVLVALAAGRVLLHQTTYLADLSGPASREWTPVQTGCVLGGLAAALIAVWFLLAVCERRAGGRAVPLALAVAIVGAGLTVMLSGYASGGEVGLPWAAGLAGATLASWGLGESVDRRGLVGLGVIGLFGLVVVGHFFGQLTVRHAVLLFLSPLFCWLVQFPYPRGAGPRLRASASVVLTAMPVVLAVVLAYQQFVRDSARSAPASAEEPSLQDYMDFGK